MSNEDKSQQKRKRAYQKPELTQVSLKPEEAVLGICKTSTTTGPGQSKCTVPANCSTPGS